MRKLDYFWATRDEWIYQKENGVFVVREDAPPEAQESYKRFVEQRKRASESVEAGLSTD